MNGDHPTSGDYAWSAAQDNAAKIARLEEEVKRLKTSLDDLLISLDNDGIITLVGPDADIDEVEQLREEEYREIQAIWESHLGKHNCYYEQSDDAGTAECPTKYYARFEEFYQDERMI